MSQMVLKKVQTFFIYYDNKYCLGRINYKIFDSVIHKQKNQLALNKYQKIIKENQVHTNVKTMRNRWTVMLCITVTHITLHNINDYLNFPGYCLKYFKDFHN